MGVRWDNWKVVYHSVTGEPVNPEYLGITKEQIENYLKDKPMPDDPAYSAEDMIYDITNSSGCYTLPHDIKDETADFVAELIDGLLYQRVASY